jgi:hypothetical protein
MYFDCHQQEQFNQLASEFNIRFHSSFAQPPNNSFNQSSAHQGFFQENNDNNIRHELQQFNEFHTVSQKKKIYKNIKKLRGYND